MFNKLDVVKWNNPQNFAEREDVMIVEDSMGVYVSVRHVTGDGLEGVSNERMEDLKYVGSCKDYERAEDVYERYKRM